jgi:hypothetical protein
VGHHRSGYVSNVGECDETTRIVNRGGLSDQDEGKVHLRSKRQCEYGTESN